MPKSWAIIDNHNKVHGYWEADSAREALQCWIDARNENLEEKLSLPERHDPSKHWCPARYVVQEAVPGTCRLFADKRDRFK
jgi:hypothetical protein